VAAVDYYVYILQSLKDFKRYIGISGNPEKRLIEHNKGLVRSTKHRRPFRLLRTEKFPNRLEARKRKKYFKSGHGREDLKKLIPL
jgi:putative endonuclease